MEEPTEARLCGPCKVVDDPTCGWQCRCGFGPIDLVEVHRCE